MGKRVADRTFLDTGFVVALVNDRDQHHARAAELSVVYEGRPLLTTDAVLIEIGNGLARRFKTEAVAVIRDLTTSPEVQVVRTTPELFGAAFVLYQTHADKAWGLTDCISFVVMREHGLTDALTPDQHFAQAGFTALMR